MRRIIPILVLTGLLAGCSGASETDNIATVTNPSTTTSQFYISPGTGPVGERFLGDRTVQELKSVIATRNQFYIATGTGPVGERFLAADGGDL
jgi:phage major head subunit gpT-like protein